MVLAILLGGLAKFKFVVWKGSLSSSGKRTYWRNTCFHIILL